MKNNSRTKRLPKIIISQALILLLMVSMALSILFYANGYRLNLKNFKVIKTGLIYLDLDSNIDEVLLSIDGKEENVKLPYSLNVNPKNYDIKIKKEGYQDWQVNAKIESEKVTEYRSIILFKSKIDSQDLTDTEKISLLNKPKEDLVKSYNSQNLHDNGYEIWQNNILVTRFSSYICSTRWYKDNNHIVFQQGNEIRIIEKTGQNDTLLVKLSSFNAEKFTFSQKGDEIYYTDNGKYKYALIR